MVLGIARISMTRFLAEYRNKRQNQGIACVYYVWLFKLIVNSSKKKTVLLSSVVYLFRFNIFI